MCRQQHQQKTQQKHHRPPSRWPNANRLLTADVVRLAREPVEVAECDEVERLLDRPDEPPRVGPVRPPGVTAATVEPMLDQVLVGIGLSGDDRGGASTGTRAASGRLTL